MGVGCQSHAPVALFPGKKATTHYIGCWVGPTAGLGGCGITRPPHWGSIPGRPARNELLYSLVFKLINIFYSSSV